MIMQKLEPRNADLKPTTIGHVDTVGCFIFSLFLKLKMHGVSSDRITVTMKAQALFFRLNVV